MNTTRRTIACISIALAALPFAGNALGAAAAGPTFNCDPGFYQVISGQLAKFDPGASTYSTIGADLSNYNALGYRIADGYMYGLGQGNVYRIDADGVRTTIGSLGGLSIGYTGTFGDDGLLHVSSGGRDWHTIDVDTMQITPVPELSVPVGVADITNVNGAFYGVNSRGGLVRFDPTNLTVTQVGQVAGLPTDSMSYGAAWSTAGGNLYVGRNSGEIYQITGYSTGTPVATQVGATPPTNSNDGAACELAAPPAGLADVDGPTPETAPSTPEAQAAADAYTASYVETAIVIPEPQPIAPATQENTETFELPDAGIGSGDTCGATVDVDRPARGVDGRFTVVDDATQLFTGFSGDDASSWDFLSGVWAMNGGTLGQVESCDFDATALLRGHVVRDFRWEATFASTSSNQGGLLINQQSNLTRSGATLIDLSEDGSAVRWGTYDERGRYVYIGGEPITAPAPGIGVTLAVLVHGEDVIVEVDGSTVGTFTTRVAGGQVGLVATQSIVSFSSATLTALPATDGAS